MDTRTKLSALIDIMHTLRRTCPVAANKTSPSLVQYAIEEAYELEDAIRSGDVHHIRDELGDLLLQVIFHGELYAEQGLFDFDDIIDTLTQKLIRRHPHVFDPDHTALTGDIDEQITQIRQIWRDVKAHEKANTPNDPLSHVKPGSALMQSQHLQHAAAASGFDWPDVHGAMDKLHEEIAELTAAIEMGDRAHIEDELGDCFFSLVNVARKLQLDSEMALLRTTTKFRSRIRTMAQLATDQQTTLSELNLDQLEALWQQSKTFS